MNACGLATVSLGDMPTAVAVQGGKALSLSHIGLNGDLAALLDRWDETRAVLDQVDAATWSNALALGESAALAPCIPRQVFCTGANYRKHVIGLIAGRSCDADRRARSDDAGAAARACRKGDGRRGRERRALLLPQIAIVRDRTERYRHTAAQQRRKAGLGTGVGRRHRQALPSYQRTRRWRDIAGFAKLSTT